MENNYQMEVVMEREDFSRLAKARADEEMRAVIEQMRKERVNQSTKETNHESYAE